MALDQRTPKTSGITTTATQMAGRLTGSLGALRHCLDICAGEIARAPGGKAAVCAELGADCQEAVDVMGDMAALVNAHLPAGETAITAPLVQGDVPA